MIIKVIYSFLYSGLTFAVTLTSLISFFVFLDYIKYGSFNYEIIVKTFKVSFFLGILIAVPYLVKKIINSKNG